MKYFDSPDLLNKFCSGQRTGPDFSARVDKLFGPWIPGYNSGTVSDLYRHSCPGSKHSNIVTAATTERPSSWSIMENVRDFRVFY